MVRRMLHKVRVMVRVIFLNDTSTSHQEWQNSFTEFYVVLFPHLWWHITKKNSRAFPPLLKLDPGTIHTLDEMVRSKGYYIFFSFPLDNCRLTVQPQKTRFDRNDTAKCAGKGGGGTTRVCSVAAFSYTALLTMLKRNLWFSSTIQT